MERTLEFERTRDGRDLLWRVDDLLWRDMAVTGRNTLAMLLTVHLADASSAFGAMRLNRAAALLDKAARREGAVLVAVGNGQNMLEAVLYCRDVKQAGVVAQAVDKRIYQVEASCYGDPDWVVFKEDIYPDAAHMQKIKNAELAAVYEKRGDDLAAPRKVNHHLAFADEPNRLDFCEEARRAGFALGDSYFATDSRLPHTSFVCKIMPIDRASLDRATTALITIANRHGGEYLYWDCQLIGKKRY